MTWATTETKRKSILGLSLVNFNIASCHYVIANVNVSFPNSLNN